MHRDLTTRRRTILRSPLGPAAKLLLWEIVDHARHGRGDCTRTNAALAAGVRLPRRHVGRLLDELSRAGWLVVQRHVDRRGSVRRRIRMGPTLDLDDHTRESPALLTAGRVRQGP